MDATSTLVDEISVRAACAGMGLPRASYYRAQCETGLAQHTVHRPRRSPLALNEVERQGVIEMLTLTLRGLERDGLVTRTQFPTTRSYQRKSFVDSIMTIKSAAQC